MSKKPVVCISDIHGCFETLLVLIEQAKNKWGDFDLYFCGDLIDRGPKSRQVVEYAMHNKIPTVLGNHEDLALAYSEHAKLGYKSKCGDYYDYNIWIHNGGDTALNNWGNYRISNEVLNWMSKLPIYIIPDTESDENGRRLLISHTGYGLDADLKTKDGWFRAIWARHGHDCDIFTSDGKGNPKDDGFFRVFGHTRVKQAIIETTWANIDTGAAYGGCLTAFHWPSKQTISQYRID